MQVFYLLQKNLSKIRVQNPSLMDKDLQNQVLYFRFVNLVLLSCQPEDYTSHFAIELFGYCLLYTSDAADE